MVSYKNLFLIKGMSAWLWLSSTIPSMWTVLRQWIHPTFSTWYLYPQSLFPLSYHYRYGHEESEWKYCPDTNELFYCAGMEKEGTKNDYRIGWLSARTVRDSISKDMDDFLNSLRIRGEHLDSLPSSVLLQAWSLYDKRWWSAEPTARLEWIDASANESSAPCMEGHAVPVVPCRVSKKN